MLPMTVLNLIQAEYFTEKAVLQRYIPSGSKKGSISVEILGVTTFEREALCKWELTITDALDEK